MNTFFSRTLLLILFVAAADLAIAQQPGTEIYLAPLSESEDAWSVGEPQNITNHPGYDNQPYFLPDGSALLFTSIRDQQADIFRYDLEKRESTPVTSTPESEYSAAMVPGSDSIAVVQAESDGTQRLWKFPLSGGKGSLISETLRAVGYHAWIDPNTVVVFVLGDVLTLHKADLKSGETKLIAEDVGRSLQNIPGTANISFPLWGEETWVIKEYDSQNHRIRSLVTALAANGEGDHAWAPDGTIFMAAGSKLYQWKQGKDPEWREIADFSGHGITGISRLAVNAKGDRLAFVAEER